MTPEEKLKAILKIANNALYFDDSSDYASALFEILATVNPDVDEDNLKFIE